MLESEIGHSQLGETSLGLKEKEASMSSSLGSHLLRRSSTGCSAGSGQHRAPA